MKVTKKLLSVFLAVIMLMSSMSVCFGTFGFTAAAADDTATVQAFVDAMKCDAMKTFSTTGGNVQSSGSNSNKTETRTWTYTAPSYSYYEQVVNVITKLDAAIKGLDEYKNGHTHNSNGNCSDGWYDNAPFYVPEESKNECTDLGFIRKYLEYAIGDAELATLNGTYNLSGLFGAVFNMDDVPYRNADGSEDYDDTTTERNVLSARHNILVVKVAKVSDKLLSYTTINDVPESLGGEYQYKLSMTRQNYTTTSGCDTTNHYHIAINSNNDNGKINAPTQTGTTTTDKAVLVNTETVFANNADYINTADVNAVLALSEDIDALTLIKEAIESAKNSVISTHSEAVYNHFFDEVKIAAAIKNLEDAITFLGFKATVDELNRLNAVDYSEYTEEELLAHLTVFEAELAKFYILEDATQQLIINSFDLDIDGIAATCADVRHEYEIIGIRRLKVQTDADMDMYDEWTVEMIDEGTLTSAEIIEAVATISNDITLFGNYVQTYVREVCGETYLTTLGEFKFNLQQLGIAADYNESFLSEYDKYSKEIKNAVAEDSETLLESVMSYDDWFTGLKALINGMKSDLGEEIANQLFDDLNEPMVEYINNAYIVLNVRTEGEINTAYDLYTAYVKANGEKITIATVSDYKALTNSIGLINTTAYEFLVTSPNFTVSQDAVAKYNELMNVDYGYEEFLASYGFSTFQTSVIGDFVREDTTDDIARKNNDIDEDGIGEYVTDDDKINKVIDVLDTALTNADVSALLGLDLGAMLSEAVEGAIISDSFINTVVDMLYPLVLKEFGKVFANDLPAESSGFTVNYKKLLHATLRDAGFEIYPDLLATELGKVNNKAAYTETISRLNAAYTEFKNAYGEDGYTTVLDPEGGLNSNNKDKVILSTTPWDSTQLRDENGKINLTWGIDAAKEAGVTGDELKALFYETFDDAVEGLKPLLLAIVANKEWDAPTVTGFANAAYGLATVELELSATPNSGYANLLVPIYEALGVSYTDVSTIEGSFLNDATKDVELIIEAILNPIFTFVDQIGNAPLDTLLGALPNICYALSTQMVTPLLSMLKTQIAYIAPVGGLGSCVGAESPSGAVDIDVGSMLNINDLIDLSDGINSILAQFGLDIPAINQGYVATLGDLVKINTQRKEAIYDIEAGKAYHINANKADVLAYVVDYLLDALAQPGFLDMIAGLLAKPEEEIPSDGEEVTEPEVPAEPEEPTEGEEGEEETDLLTTILEAIQEDPDTAIAAIVELLNMDEYDTLKKYSWYNGYINNVEVGTLTGTPAYKIYMNPENDWTKAKAEFLLTNLTSIIDAVLPMAGADFTLNSKLAEVIGGLLTNANITAIIELIAGLELDENLTNLLKNQIGVDLAAFAEMEYTAFEDGDVDGFVTALTEVVAPFAPAVGFLFEGEALKLFAGTEGEVSIPGNDGYNNAIIPLLEALGLEVKALGENDDALALILDALKGVIKSVLADPVNAIFDILPGLLYFLAGNNLATVVRNLLHPVYVLLDTVRPIYDLDIAELIANIEIGEEGDKKPLGLDIDQIDLNAVFGIVSQFVDLGTLLDDIKVLIYDVCKVIGTEYDSVSTFVKNADDWKKGAYSAAFDKADMLTVVLSFVLEWATVPANAEKLDELLGTEGIIAAIDSVFAHIEIAYADPNWMYWFSTEEEFNSYVEGNTTLPNTLAMLTYPNDWSDESAQYIADNLASLADMVIGLIEIDGTKYASLSELIGAKLDVFNAETINSIIALITDLLAEVDDNLLSAGVLLDVDIVGLKNYECTADITDVKSFAAELAYILTKYAGGLVNWLFFGDDFRFAKKSDKTDTIVIDGGLGYEKGLALVLEALGCELPEKATVESILLALATRAEAILANPVNEVIDLLPNLVYFLNADGASVAVNNLLAPVYALLDKINGLGVLEEPIDLAGLLGFDLKYLSLADILALVKEKTGLDLKAAEEILVNLCFGKIEKADYTFKMVADRKDVITVVLTTALLLVSDEDFAAKLEELLGTDVISAITEVFESAPVTYKTPEWYALDENDIDYDNETIGVIEYAITYPNNWTEESAKYIADNLGSIGDMAAGIIDSNYDSLGALLADKVNLYSEDTLKAIQTLLGDLIAGLDENLKDIVNVGLGAADALLGADVQGLLDYDVSGVKDKETFVAALTGMLMEVEGLIDWLLLGKNYKLFVDDKNDNGAYDEGEQIITLNGGHGYAEGLALVLEALGVEGLPEVYGEDEIDTEAVVNGVLSATFSRVDAILANPVEVVFDILPNVLYFINANGLTVAVENLLGAVNALLIKLEPVVGEFAIASLINIEEMLGVEKDLMLGLDNLSMEAVIELVAELTGLNLGKISDVLVGFALGRVAAYNSVSSADITAKMYYHDDFAKYDMITTLATVAILTLLDDANADKIKEMLGEDVYQFILNLVNMGEVAVQEFNWQFTDKADTDYIFSAISTSEILQDHQYGPLYTYDMSQFIADNFGDFVDNVIYLLGIDVDGDGGSEKDIKELINSFLGGSLYTSNNVIAVRDALVGILENLTKLEVNGKVVGGIIADVLKTTGIADIAAVAEVDVPEFSDDRTMFVSALCDVLEPIYGILKYVLADEDISFFVNAEKTDAITLKGAEGYAYGIIPLLEVLDCKNILTPSDYYAAVEADSAVLLTSILNPLFDRVDEILKDDPAQAILDMLPNLIYFINSNGVDTVVKNTLNAVFALLSAIEPVAKIDIYELIGVDLAVIDFQWLFDKLLEVINNGTGYDFASIDADAILELTTGKLESYTSANGKTAYKMVYAPMEELSGGKVEMVTVVERLIVAFIVHENNQELLLGLLRDYLGMSEEAEPYVASIIKMFANLAVETQLGMDTALATIYYIFYGLDAGADGAAGGVKELNALWKDALAELRDKNAPAADIIEEILGWDIFEDVLDPYDGVAPNGIIAFIKKIISWFQAILDWFRGLGE